MKTLRLAAATTLAAIFATAAHATVVVGDNFDQDNGGQSQIPFVPPAGSGLSVNHDTVSLLKSGDLGVQCVGAAGSCITLKRFGLIEAVPTPRVHAGDEVSFSFDLSGSGLIDGEEGAAWVAGLDLFSGLSLTDIVFSADGVEEHRPDGFYQSLFGFQRTAFTDTPFSHYEIRFTTLSDGIVFDAAIGNDSPNSLGGVVIDNIALSFTSPGAAPEPAAWAMMITGFGLAGAALRRRGRVTRAL